MKHASVSAEILGEKYRVSGEFETVNRMLALFRETLETVRGTTGAGEVSSHRLAVLTALALAEKLALAREREKRKSAVVAAIRREVACLVEHVGKDRS